MDSFQLQTILVRDYKTANRVKGSLAANELPYQSDLNGFYILNTDESGLPGRYWCVFYFNDNSSEFFDSLGRPPEYYHKYFKDYLLARGLPYRYNVMNIQSPQSILCGLYCIYYCYMRCQGNSLFYITRTFVHSTLDNDSLVCKYLEKQLSISINV